MDTKNVAELAEIEYKIVKTIAFSPETLVRLQTMANEDVDGNRSEMARRLIDAEWNRRHAANGAPDGPGE